MEDGEFLQSQNVPDTNSEKINDRATDVKHETTEDQKQSIPRVMTVFSNELIWKTYLGLCLNVSDLKCCRLVNRKFNQMVMGETKFRDRVVLKIKKKKLTPEEFGRTEERWRKISLTFPVRNASSLPNYKWLYPLLSEVEFLSLRLHGNAPSSATIDFHPLLGRLLASCKKLTSLALEPDFLRTGTIRISEGKETLENLEQLEILQPVNNRRPLWDDNDLSEQLKRTTEDFCEKLKNVKMYRCYFPRIRSDAIIRNLGEPETMRSWNQTMFLYSVSGSIFHNNRLHLESHFFHFMGNVAGRVREADLMCETPALVALEVDSYQLELRQSVMNFISYFHRRPLLEQLDISCIFYDPVDSSLLAGLIRSIAHHRRSLRKLKLTITLANLSDWKFLVESSLQELRLEDYRTSAEENEWIRQVMTNVPKTIEKLYLRGALHEQKQKKPQPLTKPLKLKYFTRLDHTLMTQLSIFNAGALVDNQVAKFICENFKMLRKFNLSEARTDDEGFSEIAGLKGLQYLTLKRCGISDVTLKRIQFLELRYLDVTGNLETTVDGIKMTMKQCPSLETLVAPVRECNLTKEVRRKICPRLKFLVQPNDGAPANE